MKHKVSRSRLVTTIAERCQEAADSKVMSYEIAAYLLAEGRTGELDSILRDVMQYRVDNGVVEVVAVDAHPLSSPVRNDITTLIKSLFPTAKQIIISEEIDPKVIGGVRLELANQQLDLSIRSKLNRFKQLTVATGGIK